MVGIHFYSLIPDTYQKKNSIKKNRYRKHIIIWSYVISRDGISDVCQIIAHIPISASNIHPF